jgi:hypothetical protein
LLERAYGKKETTKEEEKEKEGHTQTPDESTGNSRDKVKLTCYRIASADSFLRPSALFYLRFNAS